MTKAETPFLKEGVYCFMHKKKKKMRRQGVGVPTERSKGRPGAGLLAPGCMGAPASPLGEGGCPAGWQVGSNSNWQRRGEVSKTAYFPRIDKLSRVSEQSERDLQRKMLDFPAESSAETWPHPDKHNLVWAPAFDDMPKQILNIMMQNPTPSKDRWLQAPPHDFPPTP